MELSPLRTLDDFVLGSARFQLPNIRDFEKWGNRVVKNLLYYQTNYFIMSFGIYGLISIWNIAKVMCGLIVQAMLIAILMQFFRSVPTNKANFIATRLNVADEKTTSSQQKWYFLAGALLFSYLLLHCFDAILFATFTLLFPISLTFIHASLRLRNIKNKVVNTMESFGPTTPMGALLDAVNITSENNFN